MDPFIKDVYIRCFFENSDRYGRPYLLGIMDTFGVNSLLALTLEQCELYAVEHKLIPQNLLEAV